MPMYVRHTEPVRIDDLPAHIREKLAAYAESHQIELTNVRAWLTHSENPPASSGLGKLMRRRANPTDPDVEHHTVLVLHPTQIIIVVDGAKRGTNALSLPLAQASVTEGTALGVALDRAADESGFTITGFDGDQIGSFYIGLGPEPAAAECFSSVQAAIRAAKNPNSK